MFADHTREIAAGVVALLEDRPLPTGVRPLRQVYTVIAGGSVLLIGLALLGLVRAVCRPRGKTGAIVVFDLLLPAVALLAAPALSRGSCRAMWEAAPDITLTVAVAVLLGMLSAGVKLMRSRAQSTTNPA